MATVYSLICFGGKDGKTVTFTDAGDVVNLTDHGLRNGTGVVFTSSGSLPTGVTSGTTYYARSTASGTFTIHDTSAHAIANTNPITFTGTGSGTHTVKLAERNALTTDQKLRYGTAGSERMYDGITAWNTGRSAASAYDTEVCEILHDWYDATSNLTISVPAASCLITPTVNGVRTSAWHGGVWNAGYMINRTTINNNATLTLSKYRQRIEGVTIRISTTSGYAPAGISLAAPYCYADNLFVIGLSDKTPGAGINCAEIATTVRNCVAWGWTTGVSITQYASGILVTNNTFSGNTTGVAAQNTNTRGFYYNNISVGNTTNWGTIPGAIEGSAYNAGLVGEAWGSATRVTIATTDFLNYGSNIYSPALSTSPQVEAVAADYYDSYAQDIADAVRPNYINGTTDKYDIGAFEWDHGNGLKPEVRTIDFSGLVSGSQVVVYTTSTTTELTRNNSTGTTLSWDAATSGVTVDYTVMKAGYIPIRVTGVALSSTSTPVTIAQQLDRAYVASSGLTFGTNAIVNVTSRVVTSMQVTAATTVQNWYSYLIESWIASTTNTTLKNVQFPVVTFGEASFTVISGIEFSDGATSIAKFTRDGLRYASDSVGVTATAIWAAILTLDTAAGLQVKYRQTTGGSIVSAANTGAMDQLVQVYGDASHGNFDYRDHMVLKVQKVGYTQPKPDLVATYGNLADGLYVAGLAPALQYACTDADIDAAHLALDNTAKTYIVSASHTGAELYQRAQWWANQDAQWDADVPLTTIDGGTYALATGWTLSGLSYITSGTISGGTCTLSGAGTYSVGFSGTTVVAQAEGTYVFTAGTITLTTAPTADNVHYILGTCTLTGTLTVNNTNAHPIVVEVPAGVTTSSTGNTGGAVTFSAPGVYQSVTVSGATAGTRIQIYDTTSSTELYNGTPTFPYTWTDGVGASSTRAIRVRAAYVSGVTAKTFIEASIGTCATSGTGKDLSYLVSQTADSTYDSNGANGPSIYATSGITFTDAATDLVNCNIGGGSVTWSTIYACFVYWNFTSTGIANDFTYVSAPDTANYILSGMKIRNTSATPLTITGGYGRDASTGAVKDIIDTAGSTGNVFPAPDHVVPYQTTGTYAITGDISTVLTAIPSAATVATAVLSAATSAPIASNIKQVNSQTISGTGSAENPWNP